MAKQPLTLEQITEGAKNLSKDDFIAHYKNVIILMDAQILEKQGTIAANQQDLDELNKAKGK